MRIISQDGTIDVNYDDCIIELCEIQDSTVEIGAVIVGWRTIATYSTKEQALAVMAEIRETWLNGCETKDRYAENTVYQMPTDKGDTE